MKKFFLFIGLALMCAALYFSYNKVSAGGTDDSIAFIQRHIGGRGQLQDLQDEIGIETWEDLKWFDLGEKIELQYGKIKLKFSKEEIMKKETIQKLNSININVKYNEKEDTYKFYYYKDEIDKYVK